MVSAAYVALAAAFVISSTVQIARSVFDDAPAGGGGPVPAACAAGVRELEIAIDRALTAASSERDPAEAAKRYREARRPEWDEARQRELVRPCEGDARGTEAVAAVTRLDRAAEGAAGARAREMAELEPVRRTVDSFIR